MKSKREYDNEEPRAIREMKNKNVKKTKKKKGLKILGIIAVILAILLGSVAGGGLAFINSKLGKMQQVDIEEADLAISSQAQKELANYRNIAIFGVDSRDNNLEKGNRSDCIIIASINKKTKEVRLISVYRDTYVQIEGHGLDKITHAYSYGSALLAMKTLNQNLDLNIT